MRIQFGEYTFDSDSREIRRDDGRPVHLTPKAFDLLHSLIAECPRAMSKAELRERLWPDVVVAEANLKNLVAEIRAVLGGDVIRTVQRHGLRGRHGPEGQALPVRGIRAAGRDD